MTIVANVIAKPETYKQEQTEEHAISAGLLDSFQSKLECLATQFVQDALMNLSPLLQAPCGLAFYQFEQALFVKSVELAAQSTGSFLLALHQHPSWPASVAALARHQQPSLIHKGMRTTPVRLLDGSIVYLDTPYLLEPPPPTLCPQKQVGQRGKAGAGCYPVLEALGIRHQATPALQSEVAQTSMQVASFEEAQEVLAHRGCQMGLKVVQRLAQALADDAVEQQDARLDAADAGVRYSDEFVGQRLLIGVDGGRIRTRVYKRKGRPRKSGRIGFEGPWREPKLYAVYILDEQGKPKKGTLPLYDATMGDADFAFELLVAELKLRGASQAKEIIVTSDGAKWIFNRTEELAKLLGLQAEQITRVLDFYHACERLNDVMDACNSLDAQEKKQWYTRHRQLLLQGKVPEVLRAIRILCRGQQKKVIQKHLRYLETKQEFMNYGKARALGIPRGSGATESAIRRVINLRLKGAGSFWLLGNVERLLHLRASLKSGHWNEMIARVLHQHPNGQPPQLPAIKIDFGKEGLS